MIRFVKFLILLSAYFVGCSIQPAEAKKTPELLSMLVGGMPELYVTCHKDSLVYIRREFQQNIYLNAALTFNGKTWDRLKLRLRGDTSREFAKKSIKLKFPKGEKFVNGRKELNLNAEWLDPVTMRQHLASRLYAAAGQPCFQTEHVALFINNQYQGIYQLVESVDKQFLKNQNMDANGALFKAKEDGACLNWRDDIDSLWERKDKTTKDIWEPLSQLIKGLNETPNEDYYSFVKQNFNYDNYINSIALNMLLGNRSTYYHNYYVYQDSKTKKWTYLPWDMDQTFVFDNVHDHYGRGNLSDKWYANMPSNPYFERAVNDPRMFADIQKRVETLKTEVYNVQYLLPVIDSLSKALYPFMEKDDYHRKTAASDWALFIFQLKDYIRLRPEILLDQFAHSPRNFQLEQTQTAFQDKVLLSWSPSIDPDGNLVTYELSYSPDYHFHSDNSIYFKNLQTTTIELPTLPAPGKYFWRVFASDGTFKVRGFDNVSTFEVIKP